MVHTAAASNLGQMLVKICQADGVPLVNIVRRQDQAELLNSLGAKFVLDSSRPDFMDALTDALAETGATLAFDAVGGGSLGSDILTAMERACNRNATGYSRYGSTTHKQLYFYGSLDTSPSLLVRNYGMYWSAGGWLLTSLLKSVGRERQNALRERIANELTTTFASHYTHEISLAEALQLDTVRAYQRKATGQKYLIVPWG
jgi:NADPH2:quinone reductase